jgi:hypothetical protein
MSSNISTYGSPGVSLEGGARRAGAWRTIADALIVGVLSLYVLSGVTRVPFHGDEATILFMSRDLSAMLSGRIAEVLYRDPPLGDPAAQELRLLNGNLTFLGMGALWLLAGFRDSDLNAQWDWGASIDHNVRTGHLPRADLLFVARLWGAFCTCLSLAAVMALARRAARALPGGAGDLAARGMSWAAALIYALLPIVLVNGRRATFEGATLLTLALAMLAAMVLVRHTAQRTDRPGHWAWMGVAAGLAISAKHTLLLVMPPLLLGVLVTARWGHASWRRGIVGSVLAGVLMLGTFLALNPAWWSADPALPGVVAALRLKLIQDQATAYGTFGGGWERVAAATTAVIQAPQYFEVEREWRAWLADPITQYEAAGMSGLALPIASLSLAAVGLLHLLRRPVTALLAALGVLTMVALAALNPLPWQRYYVPLAPFVALAYAAGGMVVWRWAWALLRAFFLRSWGRGSHVIAS